MSQTKVKTEILISIMYPKAEEFIEWLKAKGFDAHMVIHNDDSIDKVWASSCAQVKEQLDKLRVAFTS